MPIPGLEHKFEQMTRALEGVKSLYVLCHDNPDPDALASMLGLRFLFSRYFRIRVRLVYGGEIGRAENQAMARLLKIPAENIEKVRIHKNARFALVDTQPQFQNNSLPDGARVLLVFDHHPPPKKVPSSFYHVNRNLGATSTLVYNYIRHAGLQFDSRLATAFAYALISETQDLGRDWIKADRDAYLYLLPLANNRILYKITHPKVPRGYFHCYNRAIENSRIYEDILVFNLYGVA